MIQVDNSISFHEGEQYLNYFYLNFIYKYIGNIQYYIVTVSEYVEDNFIINPCSFRDESKSLKLTFNFPIKKEGIINENKNALLNDSMTRNDSISSSFESSKNLLAHQVITNKLIQEI